MADNRMFRTALFGGYNKEDVEEYIKNLESEIDSIKVLHQKEKNDLMRQIGEQKAGVSAEEAEQLKSEIEKLRKENSSIPDLREETEKLREENSKIPALREEIIKLRKEHEEYEALRKQPGEERDKSEKNQENDFFDYDTVTRILEEARKNAADIEEKSRVKAEKMLEEAKQETERQKDIIVRKINTQLEEKGIQLLAAKYKIEQYAKELDGAQQGLYNLNLRVKKLIDNMPVRLDDYWEGEHYRSLENKRLSEHTDEGKAEQDSGESVSGKEAEAEE